MRFKVSCSFGLFIPEMERSDLCVFCVFFFFRISTQTVHLVVLK